MTAGQLLLTVVLYKAVLVWGAHVTLSLTFFDVQVTVHRDKFL